MRIDRAKLEQVADDLKYQLGQLQHHPEQVRRIAMGVLAGLVIFVTAIVWIARAWPEARAPEAEAFRRAHRTTEDWVSDASGELTKDKRYEHVAVTYSDKGIIVMGQVATNADLAALRQVLMQSKPPMGIEWQVSAASLRPGG